MTQKKRPKRTNGDTVKESRRSNSGRRNDSRPPEDDWVSSALRYVQKAPTPKHGRRDTRGFSLPPINSNGPKVNRTLYVIRGAPGSGKSHLANAIAPGNAVSADDWFHKEAAKRKTTYEKLWSDDKLNTAHAWCLDQIIQRLDAGYSRVAVANVFAKAAYMKPYLAAAIERRYTPFVIRCDNNYGNTHGVEQEVVERVQKDLQRCKHVNNLKMV